MTQPIHTVDTKFDRKEKVISIFFIVFSIVIIVVLILQFNNAKNMDKRYAEIITTKNKAIHATHSILIQSSTIQRALLNLTLSPDSIEVIKLEERLNSAAKNNENELNQLRNSFPLENKDEQELLKKITAANHSYKNTYQNYLQLLSSKEKTKDELVDYRIKKLRPALENYQGHQQELLTTLINNINKKSQLLSDSNSKTSWALLVLGISPYIFVFISLLYFILKLIGINLLVRPKISS